MAKAAFPEFARGGGATWGVESRMLGIPTDIQVVLPGVVLYGHRLWWGRRWALVGRSAAPWPEPITLYVARDRIEHGYWRDVQIDDEPFDRRYFIYCDVPALARVLLGPATREAIDASYDATNRRTLALHVHGGGVETESHVGAADRGAATAHGDVHRALAADAERLTAYWERLAHALGAVVTRAWPPQMAVLRPIGQILIDLSWVRPSGPAAAEWSVAARSLATIVTAVDLRGAAPGWRLVHSLPRTPAAFAIDERWIEPVGYVPDLARLAPQLTDLAISGLACDPGELSISLAGLATEARIAEGLALLERLVSPESRGAPYR